MKKDPLRYDQMVDTAFRGLVRDALRVAQQGLPGNHHFYITFRTGLPGVAIPDYLRAQYPAEMTIVLQFQFFGLEVDDEQFSVTLSFNSVHERLTVPFAAVTTFADPSVPFQIDFKQLTRGEADSKPEGDTTDKADAGEEAEELPKTGQVVALDAFRKK
jgi:hypothetical protein